MRVRSASFTATMTTYMYDARRHRAKRVSLIAQRIGGLGTSPPR